MSLSNWDIFTSLPGTTTVIQGTGALVGSGSLEFTGSNNVHWQIQLDSGQSRGFTKGKLRTLYQYQGGGTAANSRAGIFCLSSAENITTSGNCYAVIIKPLDSTPDNIELRKGGAISGLSAATVLGNATKDAASATVAIELEWDYNIPEAGGTVLRVRLGDALDFSDLSLAIEVTDGSSPHSSGFAEGLFHNCNGAGSPVYLFDSTRIFEGS